MYAAEYLHYREPAGLEPLRFVTPQEFADAWESGATAKSGKWSTNLQQTTKPIVQAAVDQKSVLVTNFVDSVNSGRWEAGLRRVGDAGIKAAAKAKEANFGVGVSAAKGKMLAVATKLLPYITQGQAMIETMPSGNIGASKARVNAWIDYMHAGKGQFGA